MKPSFAEGIIVQYRDWVGEIRFVCDEYLSICVRVGKNRVNDICVLVHRNDWNQVKLLKESGK
jgi:hypothetical protein